MCIEWDKRKETDNKSCIEFDKKDCRFNKSVNCALKKR